MIVTPFHSILKTKTMSLPLYLLSFILFIVAEAHGHSQNQTVATGGGRWELLQKSIGIAALHMQLLHSDRVIILDRSDYGTSNISLPNGKCRHDSHEKVVKIDCTAHSVEYDVYNNSVRALMIQTDVWCASGAVAPEGYLINSGGFNDGEKVVRTISPCKTCDWTEKESALHVKRWYASNHILPDGEVIIIGGRGQHNYEFYPKRSYRELYKLHFLAETWNGRISENNLYPFVHLNVDGNLFIFANNRAILLDYKKNVIVKTFPTIPGGEPRNYPSTGSSVLLPFVSPNEAEVLICGGAPIGSAVKANNHSIFVEALSSCGRLKITDKSPKWSMETMPIPRCMGDMILLPNGNVLIINGVSHGVAGWEQGRNPVLNPVVYRPKNPSGSRFEILNPTTIPRLYHSSALLLRDGRILVAGSNPHIYFNFTGVLFPTELRLEAFSPDYLEPNFSSLRPNISSPISQTNISYGQKISIQFSVPTSFNADMVSVTMVAPPFATHTFSMNQRLLVLENSGNTTITSQSMYAVHVTVQVTAPGSGFLAPPGYYMLFVLHKEIPSEGIWVQLLKP